jgi:hypothetical protein
VGVVVGGYAVIVVGDQATSSPKSKEQTRKEGSTKGERECAQELIRGQAIFFFLFSSS